MSSNEDAILERAAAEPTNVRIQIDAAFYCDAHRTEEEAIGYYDAAWSLGVPQEQRRQFMLGYGSTLKNVGRLLESESIFREAITENPGHEPLVVFLSLTLHEKGDSTSAIAELIDALLRVSDSDTGIPYYARALSHYSNTLREQGQSSAKQDDVLA